MFKYEICGDLVIKTTIPEAKVTIKCQECGFVSIQDNSGAVVDVTRKHGKRTGHTKYMINYQIPEERIKSFYPSCVNKHTDAFVGRMPGSCYTKR